MPNDEDLDILTYDRILGEDVSGQDLLDSVLANRPVTETSELVE